MLHKRPPLHLSVLLHAAVEGGGQSQALRRRPQQEVGEALCAGHGPVQGLAQPVGVLLVRGLHQAGDVAVQDGLRQ